MKIRRAVRQNLAALKRSNNEGAGEYRSRLLFEFRRRCIQLRCRINPLSQEQYRLEKLAGPMGIWPDLERYQFNILLSRGLKAHHSLLDIGCGPITVGLTLLSYLDSGNYFGLDAREEPLTAAYNRIVKHALSDRNPRLIRSSVFGKNEIEPRQFDYIWMSQLSYHLDDAQMTQLFEQARLRMNDRSMFLIDILDPGIVLDADASWNGFSYFVRPYEYYHALAQRFSLSLYRRGTIREHGYPQHINLSANRILEFRKLAPSATDQASPA